MTAVSPLDWLDWHSTRTAQDHAIRLALACSAVMPSDKKMQRLVDEQITTDLIGFAVHGRRAMERKGSKSASLSSDPLWPASSVLPPEGVNLWAAFGAIVHAVELKIEWESVEINPSPYSGRDARFAGSVKIKSEERRLRLPIGSLVAAFFAGFMNKAGQQVRDVV